jgi:hypothetical protein
MHRSHVGRFVAACNGYGTDFRLFLEQVHCLPLPEQICDDIVRRVCAPQAF